MNDETGSLYELRTSVFDVNLPSQLEVSRSNVIG